MYEGKREMTVMEDRELVTDIQRFSVNDGPGFRTNVYLKGCPLRCRWCHNPETIAVYPEIYWKKRLCVQCGACLQACPKEAINPPVDPVLARQEDSPYHKIIRSRCDLCMKCVDACSYDALEIVGRPMTVKEILDEVEKDRPFYENSGGGMTLSGGEPTAHADFSEKLLKEARRRGIHTCLDTNGFCPWEVFERLIPDVDVVLYDIKHLDPAKHEEMTGAGNEIILANLERLLSAGAQVWVRVPVIPGFNDDMAFHQELARFLLDLPRRVCRVDLLPYHNWCQDKYGWLGIDWEMKEIESADPGFLEIFADIYREEGLKATVGGSGFEEAGSASGG